MIDMVTREGDLIACELNFIPPKGTKIEITYVYGGHKEYIVVDGPFYPAELILEGFDHSCGWGKFYVEEIK